MQTDIIGKADKGLDLVMDLGSGPKTNYKVVDEFRILVIPKFVVGLDHRKTRCDGTKFGGLSIDSGDEVATKGTLLPS